MPLWAQETYINADENYIFGESEVYETFAETPGELYRAMQREYGRCTNKIYIDTEAGPLHVGWTFIGRQKYEDTYEPYLREVWVTLHEKPDTVTREHHYATASKARP